MLKRKARFKERFTETATELSAAQNKKEIIAKVAGAAVIPLEFIVVGGLAFLVAAKVYPSSDILMPLVAAVLTGDLTLKDSVPRAIRISNSLRSKWDLPLRNQNFDVPDYQERFEERRKKLDNFLFVTAGGYAGAALGLGACYLGKVYNILPDNDVIPVAGFITCGLLGMAAMYYKGVPFINTKKENLRQWLVASRMKLQEQNL